MLISLDILHLGTESKALGKNYGSCSGSCESGAQCNKYGNPPKNKMFACKFNNGSYGCYAVPINDGGNHCYLDCEANWQSCGCDINECKRLCKEENKDKGPGSYTYTMKCTSGTYHCNQKFTCGCQIGQALECGDECPSGEDSECGYPESNLYCENEGNGPHYCVYDDSELKKCGVNDYVDPDKGGVCLCQGEVDECPYTSTEARVRETVNSNWQSSITIDEGGAFRIAGFHNGTTGVYAEDIQLYLEDSEGGIFYCDGDESGCNNQLITNALAGVYTLTVRTYNPLENFYDDPDCDGLAHTYVNVIPKERDFDLFKRVVGKSSYEEGEVVTFEIEIVNLGEVIIDELYFEDQYNPRFLNFIDIVGKRINNNTTISSMNLSEYIQEPEEGELQIEDLTLHLGDLNIDEGYILEMSFKTLSVNNDVETCNYAFADDSYEQEDDIVCIDINYEEPPPTDR